MLIFFVCTRGQNLAYEIILTLGQAFEVAYQLALQARKSGHGSSTLPESFDSKPSKPIPKPRSNIRKSVSAPHTLLHTLVPLGLLCVCGSLPLPVYNAVACECRFPPEDFLKSLLWFYARRVLYRLKSKNRKHSV